MSLTVKRLKELLENIPDDMPVMVDGYEMDVNVVKEVVILGVSEKWDNVKEWYTGDYTTETHSSIVKPDTLQSVLCISREKNAYMDDGLLLQVWKHERS